MMIYAAKEEHLVFKTRSPEADTLVKDGVEAISAGDLAKALDCFERAEELSSSTTTRSFLAYCLAEVHGDWEKGLSLAIKALRDDPRNPLIYLNIARIQVLAGRKKDAVRMLLKGQSYEGKVRTSIFQAPLERLGIRKPPPLTFLSRSNPINKYLGLFLARIGLR